MERHNDRLAVMISSSREYVDHELTQSLIALFAYLPDEIILEIVRCANSTLAGRLEPEECGTIEGFVAVHRKVLGLFLDSLDMDE